jgi:metal transporter CNNM
MAPLTAALEDAGEIPKQGPSIILEAIDPTPLVNSVEEAGVTDRVKSNKPVSLVVPVSAVPGSGAASRSVSPAPSLEAILLDRKRRLAAASGHSTPPIVPTLSPGPIPEIRPPNPRMATTGVKGTRFKSSPLGGFDKHGVIIAEKVKEEIRNQNVSQDDVRIPDDNNKAGLDK